MPCPDISQQIQALQHKQATLILCTRVCTFWFGKTSHRHACAEFPKPTIQLTSCMGNWGLIVVVSLSRGQWEGEEASLLSHSLSPDDSGSIPTNDLFSSLIFACLLSNSSGASASWHRDGMISRGLNHLELRRSFQLLYVCHTAGV